jgi:hypothetical protein
MIRRIFLLEAVRNLDVSKAAAVAPITTVFDENRRRGEGLFDPRFRNEELPKALAYWNFDPSQDAILMAGHTVVTVMAIANVVAEYGYANVMFFNSVDRDYTLTTVGDMHAARS